MSTRRPVAPPPWASVSSSLREGSRGAPAEPLGGGGPVTITVVPTVAVAGSPGSVALGTPAGDRAASGSRQAVKFKQRPPSLHWLQHEKPKPKQNAAPALTSAFVSAEASTHWDIRGCHALNRVPGVRLHSVGVPWARGGGGAGSFLWAPPPRTLGHLQRSLPGVVPSTTPPSSAPAITPEGCPGACGYCPPGHLSCPGRAPGSQLLWLIHTGLKGGPSRQLPSSASSELRRGRGGAESNSIFSVLSCTNGIQLGKKKPKSSQIVL